MMKDMHKRIAGLMGIKKVKIILVYINIFIYTHIYKVKIYLSLGYLVGPLGLEILWSTPSLLFLFWYVNRWRAALLAIYSKGILS